MKQIEVIVGKTYSTTLTHLPATEQSSRYSYKHKDIIIIQKGEKQFYYRFVDEIEIKYE